MSFLGTKSCLTEKLRLQMLFFFLIQKVFFKTMELKLVQRCETKVGADACKASHQLFIVPLPSSSILYLLFSWESKSGLSPALRTPLVI